MLAVNDWMIPFSWLLIQIVDHSIYVLPWQGSSLLCVGGGGGEGLEAAVCVYLSVCISLTCS